MWLPGEKRLKQRQWIRSKNSSEPGSLFVEYTVDNQFPCCHPAQRLISTPQNSSAIINSTPGDSKHIEIQSWNDNCRPVSDVLMMCLHRETVCAAVHTNTLCVPAYRCSTPTGFYKLKVIKRTRRKKGQFGRNSIWIIHLFSTANVSKDLWSEIYEMWVRGSSSYLLDQICQSSVAPKPSDITVCPTIAQTKRWRRLFLWWVFSAYCCRYLLFTGNSWSWMPALRKERYVDTSLESAAGASSWLSQLSLA